MKTKKFLKPPVSPLGYGVLLLFFFYKQHQIEKQILKKLYTFLLLAIFISCSSDMVNIV
jgi:hypothetical protein